jgi:hypothetical protein
MTVFLKRVCVVDLPRRDPTKCAKDVQSYHVERSFYTELAAQLRAAGLQLPDMLFGESTDVSVAGDLTRVGFLYLFADLGATHATYLHVSYERMCATMAWAARLHSIFWTAEGAAMPAALACMWDQGTYWALDKRPASEVPSTGSSWRAFCEGWRHVAPELFSRPEIIDLGYRLARQASRMDAWLRTRSPRTLVHGDLKGAHLFFRVDASTDSEPTVIDWQWSGFASPLVDVVYAIQSITAFADLQHGGEERLLQAYLAALRTHGIDLGEGLANQLYKAALLDYARIVLGYFFRGVSVSDIEREHENITELTHTREVAHALRFIGRVDDVLREIETLGDFDDASLCGMRHMRDAYEAP